MEINKEELLSKVKEEFEFKMPEVTYSMAIEPMQIELFNEDLIVISLPTKSHVNLLINNHFNELVQTFEILTNKKHKIEILDKSKVDEYLLNYSKENLENVSKPVNINPLYTFDTFVVGDNNRLAAATALAVANNPSRNV